MNNKQPIQNEAAAYVLPGLLAGLMATVANFGLFFLLAKSDVAATALGTFNPFTIFYGSLLPPVLGGIGYYLLSPSKMSLPLYILVTGGLFVWAAIAASSMHHVGNPVIERRYHALLLTIIVATGLFTVIITPLFILRPRLTKNII